MKKVTFKVSTDYVRSDVQETFTFDELGICENLNEDELDSEE